MNRLISAAISALVAVASIAGTASATPPTPASGTIWSPNQRVTYRWKQGDEPPTWMRAAINAAADDSTSSRASRAAIFAQSDSGSSSISYTADIPTTYAIGYTIGFLPNYFTMRFRPQGYQLDWGTLRWCQFYDTPPTGCYDAEMIALHELGHAQTLDHADDTQVTDWTDTIMHWAPKSKAKAGWNQHEFGRCDVARLQIRYQPLTTSTPISTCLDLGTGLSVSASTSSVPYGGSATLTARLTIADDAIWPNLASDPLSSRQLNLQKRAIGATSWSNAGTLGALDDNGRYTRTLTLYDTYDYRVVFNAPSDEGLQFSTSDVMRITVSASSGGCAITSSALDRHGQIIIC